MKKGTKGQAKVETYQTCPPFKDRFRPDVSNLFSDHLAESARYNYEEDRGQTG